MDLATVTENGLVVRDGDIVRVLARVTDDPGILNDPSITCLNPKAPEVERVYQKEFKRRKVYLPDEHDLPIRDYLRGGVRPILVIGANGYSSVKDAHLRAWHVGELAYRVAVETALETIYARVRDELGEAVDIRFVHGSSTQGLARRGVDTSIVNTATKLHCQQLGFSCPKYMMYVNDDTDFPVYVAQDKDAYSKAFVDSLDVLVSCNGRVQTLEMDIHAAIFRRKYVVLYDLLGAISPTGGPPAYGPNNEIEDAVKALITGMFMVGGDVFHAPSSGDCWKEDLLRISNAIIARVRKIPTFPPDVALHVRI